jgi:uncharacterized membrane protein YfcA
MLVPDPTLAAVIVIVFVATLVWSTFGFGEGLVAVPLLVLVIPVTVEVPVATLLSIAVAGVILLQDWRKVHVGSAWRLLIPTLAGIPIGLLGLTILPDGVVKIALAAVIIAFSTYCLFSLRQLHLDNDRWAGVFGFAAGLTGGAYGMNGPPLLVYGTLRRWTPEHFRATLQGYFLPASILGMIGYWVAGLWVPDVTRYFLYSLPVAALAVFLGRAINRQMHFEVFIR